MIELRKYSPAILGSKIKVVVFVTAVGEDARPRQQLPTAGKALAATHRHNKKATAVDFYDKNKPF
jgi:hypothetical protein